jgi:V/A-type H+/Na+-transporting ATPase subunit D
VSTGRQSMRVPPGRAGRLWLRHRLEVANRGVDLLDRKHRLLQREHERLGGLVQRTGAQWEAACEVAGTWQLRAGLLGGQRVLRLSAGGPPGEVEVVWRELMGVRFPYQVSYRPPDDGGPPVIGTTALPSARAAYREALAAASRHAGALHAHQVVAAELLATRHRLRALRTRWIPRLEAALAEVELALDELERADLVRVRRAQSDPTAP